MKKKIEELLLNKVLDITDEYKGQKRDEGIQVYLGYPQQLIDELYELFKVKSET
jgi:hypothetical protein